MKNLLLFSIFLSLYFHVYAQTPNALIKAENAFEKTCLEKGIRDGFLAFVDSNGIAFTKDGPVNAKQFWNGLPAFDGVFSWSPAFVEMSLSGDWGYTTGNYEHRPKTMNDPINDFGQYTTVWHRTFNGEWKYLIDVGNDHPPASLDKQAKIIEIIKISSADKSKETLLDNPEKEFIRSFENNISAAYQKYTGDPYILNLSGYSMIPSRDSAVLLLNKIEPSLKYQPSGMKISSGKDMVAVYGTFGQDNKGGYYLRIWRHEKDGWKIALEVIKS
jgi:ketosteroid isomerase-like protein